MRNFYALLLFVGLCHGVSKASQCTSYGRFPDNEAADCRGFTICLIGGITNFTQYNLACPIGFVYSHFEQQCTNATGYRCFDSYNCSTVGNFPQPNSNDCRSYVTCVEAVNDIASARLVDCPQNTLFNANEGECVNATNYSCNQRTKKLEITNFINASVIMYDFSSGASSVYSSAYVCKQFVSLFWFLIIFLM